MVKSKHLKASKYNEYFTVFDSECVVFNNITTAMVQVPRQIYDCLRNCDKGFMRGLRKDHPLVSGGFVVPEDMNENEELLHARADAEIDATTIGLQILPTLNCNFSCPYCYEQVPESSITMSQHIMDAIIHHVERFHTPKTESLVVSWFGGEPLIALPQIRYLSESFISFAEEKGLNYVANVVSNGYRMDRTILHDLLQWHVQQVQVTLDGPQTVHDSRRFLRSGGPTYDRIIDNLKAAVSAGLQVTVRVNLDRSNIRALPELLQDLKRHGLLNTVKISLAPVINYKHTCGSIESCLMESDEISRMLEDNQVIELLGEQDHRDYRRLYPDLLGCIAESPCGLIITPDGTLYKCSKTIGDPYWSCGNIVSFEATHHRFREFVDASRYEIDQCKSCGMLPVCPRTGCVFEHVVLGKERSVCDVKKAHSVHLRSLIEIYKNARHEPCRTSNS